MNNPFKFKQFSIHQESAPHKIGTDSMLLGAWTKGDFKRILDVGTGTGILSLMMAQKYPSANITAIEPNAAAFEGAVENFKNSDFKNRILGIQTTLQQFGSMEQFDLIISNPPYYNATYLSENAARNQARHTAELPIHEFYSNTADLLAEDGRLNVVIPFTEEREHIERAFDHELFIQEILHTLTPGGDKKRSLISFGCEEVDPSVQSLQVKDERNRYSPEYIALTKDFYLKDLSTE